MPHCASMPAGEGVFMVDLPLANSKIFVLLDGLQELDRHRVDDVHCPS